jgi:hypothetical protein
LATADSSVIIIDAFVLRPVLDGLVTQFISIIKGMSFFFGASGTGSPLAAWDSITTSAY